MALGAELERNLVPGISGSGCSSRDAPREEANISSRTKGKAISGCVAGVESWFQHKEEEREFLLLTHNH